MILGIIDDLQDKLLEQVLAIENMSIEPQQLRSVLMLSGAVLESISAMLDKQNKILIETESYLEEYPYSKKAQEIRRLIRRAKSSVEDV